jgi:hypothetical protein
MTEAEALATMKRKCKCLSDGFTDVELTAYLNDYAVTVTVDTVSTTTYDIRRSTYDALGSMATADFTQWSAGGLSYTKESLSTLRKQFTTVGSVASVRE